AAMSDISRTVVMDKTTVSRNIASLARRDLVRYGAARDSRRKLVMTTASGRRHFVRALPAWEAAQSKVAQTIGTDAFAALVEQSKRVARTVARELGKGDGRGGPTRRVNGAASQRRRRRGRPSLPGDTHTG